MVPFVLVTTPPVLLLVTHLQAVGRGRWAGHEMSRFRALNCFSSVQESRSWPSTLLTPAVRSQPEPESPPGAEMRSG